MPSIYAFLMGLVPLVMIVMLVGAGFKVPRIHDISTDLENNIAFTNAKKLRKSTDNSLEFPSDEVIKQHQGFYGHVEPLLVDDTPSAAYEKSLSTAESLGWKILHRDDANTTFEATQTTAVFGFVDDIVVRVSSAEQGSKIDLRSVSRVGLSDLGANAKRILTFQEAYK